MSIEFRGDIIPVETTVRTGDFQEGHSKHILAAPSKILSVDLALHSSGESALAETYIANRTERRGWRKKPVAPIPGTTTKLYKKAYDIMQEAADEYGVPVFNSFVTTYPSMKRWALSAGEEIFHWSNVVDGGEGQAFNAFSTITPRPKE